MINECWLERRTGIARSRVQTPLVLTFLASIRNCLNCVHNCDDHSLLDFKIRSSIYEIFRISLHNNTNVSSGTESCFRN